MNYLQVSGQTSRAVSLLRHSLFREASLLGFPSLNSVAVI